MKKKLALLFVIAFVLNFIWEEWHSQWYVHFMGGPITHGILVYAAVVDATVIVLLACLAFLLNKKWYIPALYTVVVGGFFVSVALEWRALATDRWAYGSLMPIIPLLHTGLTPTIQLALLGGIAYYSVSRVK